MGILQAAQQSGQADFSDVHADFSPDLQAQLQPWIDKLQFGGDPAILYLAISNWGMIHGLVSLEIFGHLYPNMARESSGALFSMVAAMLAKRLSLTSIPPNPMPGTLKVPGI